MVKLGRFFLLGAACLGLLSFSNQGFAANKAAEKCFGSIDKIPYAMKGDIYALKSGDRRLPADFSKMKPEGSVYSTELWVPACDFTQGFPGVTTRNEWFAIDYNGTFTTKKDARFKFKLGSDDGSKLFIDGKVVIDNDGWHGMAYKEGSVNLKKGEHKIRVQFFQGPKTGLGLTLEWAEGNAQYSKFTTVTTDASSAGGLTGGAGGNMPSIPGMPH